jgi:hypothetical protein
VSKQKTKLCAPFIRGTASGLSIYVGTGGDRIVVNSYPLGTTMPSGILNLFNVREYPPQHGLHRLLEVDWETAYGVHKTGTLSCVRHPELEKLMESNMADTMVGFMGVTTAGEHVFKVEGDDRYFVLTPLGYRSTAPRASSLYEIVAWKSGLGVMNLTMKDKTCAITHTSDYVDHGEFIKAACRPKPVCKYMVDTSMNGPAKLVRGEVKENGVRYTSPGGGVMIEGLIAKTWYDTPQQAMDAYLKVLQQKFEMHSKSLREQVEAFHAEKQ